MVQHFEEDIILLTGATSGFYVTGGLTINITKGVQIQLLDHVTIKSVSSAPGVGSATLTLPQIQAIVGSESGQAFRLRAYIIATTGTSAGLVSAQSGQLQEMSPGSGTAALIQGLPIHVSYEGT